MRMHPCNCLFVNAYFNSLAKLTCYHKRLSCFHACAHTFSLTHVFHLHAHVHIHAHTYTHKFTCTHAHTRTCVHTHILSLSHIPNANTHRCSVPRAHPSTSANLCAKVRMRPSHPTHPTQAAGRLALPAARRAPAPRESGGTPGRVPPAGAAADDGPQRRPRPA